MLIWPENYPHLETSYTFDSGPEGVLFYSEMLLDIVFFELISERWVLLRDEKGDEGIFHSVPYAAVSQYGRQLLALVEVVIGERKYLPTFDLRVLFLCKD